MDSFRTELNLKPSQIRLTMQDQFLTVGSCFANAIGTRLEDFKFKALKNPFGTTYNPVSIHRHLAWALKNEQPPEYSFGSNSEVFFNYHFHSQFGALNKPEIISQIKQVIHQTNTYLQNTSCLLITYGTAWIYEWIDKKEIVANCHKQPASHFEKRLLKQTEIEDSFTWMHDMLLKQNPSLKIILTVSPVRHIKDTLMLNSVSKSILRLACHSIAEQNKNVEYFPSYEIMMDDLRDYRFYKQDRIHPTEEAEDYIWEKFCQSHFDETTLTVIKEWQEIKASLAHKPFHLKSEKHQLFLKNLLTRLEKLKTIINIETEIQQLKLQIRNS